MTHQPRRPRIITIAGRPGSGKSTTAKAVASKLGYKHFSSGDMFRALGKENGVDVLMGNKTPGVTEQLDEIIDGKLREIGHTDDHIVIDSRTAWHWIPESFKVFLNLDTQTAAQRIVSELSEERAKSEAVHSDLAKYAEQLEHRMDVETERYKKIYAIDNYDMNNYDLVIDTSKNGIEETIQKVLDGFESWRKS